MRVRTLVLLPSLVLLLGCVARAQQAAGTPATSPSHALAAKVPDTVANAPDSGYVIAASDEIMVTVWKEPSLSGERLVRPDGKISMSLLGDVQASGLKPMDLASEISNKLEKYVKDPEVSVVILHIHHNSVYLLGEVGKKGPVELTQGMTLLEAIASAGGLTDYAKKTKIYILRYVNGKQQRLQVNYKKALQGDAAFNIDLVPGDTIVVP